MGTRQPGGSALAMGTRRSRRRWARWRPSGGRHVNAAKAPAADRFFIPLAELMETAIFGPVEQPANRTAVPSNLTRRLATAD